MTPRELGDRLAALLGDGQAGVSGGDAWARATVDVPPARWREALRTARDDATLRADFFDWLSAVDELADGFRIVAHLWSTAGRHGLLVRTLLPRDAAVVDSVVDVYPGAAWHERETHEMFGVAFTGHPGLAPLLLPPEFDGHPLRKEFVLASRVAKAWPGAKEPGESHDAGAARRAPMRPPGVPDPNEWGPLAGQLPAEPARPRAGRAAGDRPAGGRAAGDRPAAARARAGDPPTEARPRPDRGEPAPAATPTSADATDGPGPTPGGAAPTGGAEPTPAAAAADVAAASASAAAGRSATPVTAGPDRPGGPRHSRPGEPAGGAAPGGESNATPPRPATDTPRGPDDNPAVGDGSQPATGEG